MPQPHSKYFLHIIGGLIYMAGDTIAAFISHEASIVRSLGMFVTGSTLYAAEINMYFAWIEKKADSLPGISRKSLKTVMALIYFNPLWIARHMCLVYLLSGKLSQISPELLKAASIAFLVNIPVSVAANYLIQNVIPLRYRFWSSATFSGIMAVYYSMSSLWF